MALTALDLGLRGAVVGLFLVVCAVLLRSTLIRPAASLGAAMGVAGAAYAISTAPFFPIWSFGWNSPFVALAMGFPVIFWLWARAIFEENFALRAWHGAAWAIVAALGLLTYNGWTSWPGVAATSGRLLALSSIWFALLAAAQVPKSWRKAIMTGRGRLLIALAIGISVQIVLCASAGLAAIPFKSISLTAAFGLGASALISIWMMLFCPPGSQPAVAGAGVGSSKASRASEPFQSPNLPAADRAALNRLKHHMATERTYRQEGLTIGLLSARLGMPEYRLRALINDGLGHRNFNAFLNRYRLDEAKAALADPHQAEVPVLTIALDAGFQSLAPFNRAFKADTGLTPTEFRRRAAAGQNMDDGAEADRSN
ncbi:helix-turn-helix domain-containing protein [Bradyrhizobium sp.]|jgi:AraC-like DNA-binding protein|uniref:AraC family transcriptional regulator n=1 Tax=Bradyrhizobium sp. TaxID=376 RepID=UPI002C7A0480|nr:helix-turn-helix domain-containing protein [Bradyrhizobium sp.]HWX61723.1 helix-turn-helix domain-containing protein [Bradyrhizobium sp.]